MKYARIQYQGAPRYGIIEGDDIRLMDGTPFTSYTMTETLVPISAAALLAPCEPSKGVCIGLNYRDHAEEFNLPIPAEPVVFIKPSTSLNDPEAGVVYPSQSKRLDYEAELAIVIKKTAKNIEESEVDEYILGYTCANDITARDLQPKQGQWTVAKSFDTFMPLGPVITDEVDPNDLDIESRVNGKTLQHSNTSNLIFKTAFLVSYLSKVMTLLPGDVILTGTPGGISGMQVGDKVDIVIERIGTLTNTIVAP